MPSRCGTRITMCVSALLALGCALGTTVHRTGLLFTNLTHFNSAGAVLSQSAADAKQVTHLEHCVQISLACLEVCMGVCIVQTRCSANMLFSKHCRSHMHRPEGCCMQAEKLPKAAAGAVLSQSAADAKQVRHLEYCVQISLARLEVCMGVCIVQTCCSANTLVQQALQEPHAQGSGLLGCRLRSC